MYPIPKPESNFNDVGIFHHKFGLPNTTYDRIGPREVDSELLSFRLKFLIEELLEFAEAIGYEVDILTEGDGGHVEVTRRRNAKVIDHPQSFDALIDLVYVAMGTAHLLGYPWENGWAAVQRANMAKVRAQSDGSDSKRGSSFDVVKPEGWTPPNIEALLTLFGWNTPLELKENDK